MTRWQRFYQEDPRIRTAPISASCGDAADLFQRERVSHILDLGCGTGRDTTAFASAGFDVTGVDAARSGLRIARTTLDERGLKVDLTAADAPYLPFRDCSFDAVYCFGLLHEFTGEQRRDDARTVASEALRVLVPDGLLVLTVLAGDPKDGLPHVCLFTEHMLLDTLGAFSILDMRLRTDVGCTGAGNYRVWYTVCHNYPGERA